MPEVQVPEDASGGIVGTIETDALTTAASAARKVDGMILNISVAKVKPPGCGVHKA